MRGSRLTRPRLRDRRGGAPPTGITATLTKYIEALETFWIQYFVAFDNQEQRSLAKSVRTGFVEYQSRVSSYLGHAQDLLAEWWAEVRGDKGTQASLTAVGYAIAYLVARRNGGFAGCLGNPKGFAPEDLGIDLATII